MSRVIMLTGERGVGKSTVCREAVTLARARGHACCGVLTLTRDGVRHVFDVGTGRQRRLTQPPGEGGAVVQGRFRFDPRTLEWGDTVLSQAVRCDLLVVDEIGPLEVERGQGWMTAFEVVRGGNYALALAVVRPELIAQVRGRLAGCAAKVLAVTQENRDSLPASLVSVMEREM